MLLPAPSRLWHKGWVFRRRWLVETADHLEAFSRHFLHDVDVEQVQMDELFALCP